MTTFFTSDTHFGHANIIRYCDRPFEGVEAMDEALIANWNALARPGDEVWHLGDFAFERDPRRLASIFRRLNGRKRLVIGNHDGRAVLELPWSAPPVHYAETSVDGQRLVLFHYGLRVWNGMRRKAVHLYGHSHGRLPGSDRALDVGVDCWGYAPVGLARIRKRLAGNPPHAGEPEAERDG